MAATACLIFLVAQQSFRASAAQRKKVATASTNNRPCAFELAPVQLQVPGGVIDVTFAPGKFDLPATALEDWIKRAAVAVATYYGRFPVPHASVRVVPVEGEEGVFHGTTFGDNGGFTRIPVGEHTTEDEFVNDWIMTHEFVHLAFPDMPRRHHWIEEGLATYVEPIARAQARQLNPTKVWHDMLRDMPQGEPEAGDQGLDKTHTWSRTYWGGALYCLQADVTIRRLTSNRRGLQDALRAIVANGGTLDKENWSLERALKIGDEATGTNVLQDLYGQMKTKPVQVDLEGLWKQLGVSADKEKIKFNDHADLASARLSIIEGPSRSDQVISQIVPALH